MWDIKICPHWKQEKKELSLIFKSPTIISQVVLAHAFWRQRQADLCDFHASQGYIVKPFQKSK